MNNQTLKLPAHRKISAKERDLISNWIGGSVSVSEIGRRLGRSKSSISTEIKRNSFTDSETGEKHYAAIYAQYLSKVRKAQAGKRYPLKDRETYSYVLDKLRLGWSPEQIAGRLELTYGKRIICHETIYQFIYSKENQEERLWEYLPRKQPKRRRKTGRKAYLKRIPDRISIHQRPPGADLRKEFGHWEGDSLLGKREGGHIHTEVERVSRVLAAKKIESLKSEETIEKQIEIFKGFPLVARLSTTVDNGREFFNHKDLYVSLGIKTYFADPYSSQQRGTNEYHNGLLRRYLQCLT